MKTAGSLWLQRNLSRAVRNSVAADIAEVLFLLFMGMLAVTLHAKLRIPVHLPGKHGIEFMFLVVVAFSLSHFRYAALISCSGASLLLLTNLLGFGDPFLAGIYLLVGFSLDYLLNRCMTFRFKALLIPLACGLSYAIIPLAREIIALATGFPYSSLIQGLGFPLLSHFIFGALGGFLGYIAVSSLKKK